MRRKSTLILVLILGLVLAACSSDPTTSEEYLDLEQEMTAAEGEIEDLETQLAALTAERDASVQRKGLPEVRHEKARAQMDLVTAILDNPEAFGSEEEVIEALVEHYTPDAVMDDAVFGAVPIEQAWHNTLYGGAVDAEIDVYHSWLSDDGSQGGHLWVWHGTNAAGNPFELPGISLCEFDEDGLESYEYVVYPYPDDYVRRAFTGSGT
jgi:hypothetical protein